MHTIGQDDSLDQLRRRATALDAEIAAWERIAASLTERSLPDVFWVDLRYRLALHRAELTFVNDLITRISAGDLPWPPVEKNGDQT
jgi:hypothetical protein